MRLLRLAAVTLVVGVVVGVVLGVALGSVAAAPATTGTVRGRVKVTAGGAPRRDAQVVVYLTGFDEPASDEVPEMRQRNKQFLPALLAVTAGQTVAFPNADPWFHNVFSLSSARRFDLGQFKQGEKEMKTFPRAGVVELYCNIHPEMAATILVLPNRRFASVDGDGRFVIEGVPPGTWTVYAYDRFADKPARAEVKVVAGHAADIALDVAESRASATHLNKYGQPYSGQ
jgi:plastocyanin